MKKLSKQKRKDLAWKEYKKIRNPALKEYLKKRNEIDAEPDEIPEIIEQNGVKYKRIK